jgi:hypothetical protein
VGATAVVGVGIGAGVGSDVGEGVGVMEMFEPARLEMAGVADPPPQPLRAREVTASKATELKRRMVKSPPEFGVNSRWSSGVKGGSRSVV